MNMYQERALFKVSFIQQLRRKGFRDSSPIIKETKADITELYRLSNFVNFITSCVTRTICG